MPLIVTDRYGKALAESCGTKLPIVKIRNDVTRKPGGKASGEIERQCRGKEKPLQRRFNTTFTSKSRPLFLKFFSRWLSSFSLSAMVASLVAVDMIKAVELAS